MSSEQKPSVFHVITAHPLFNFTGWLCTVVGLIAFFITLEKRELTFEVNPVRTAVVQSDASSEIKIIYQGKEVTGDITACQVAIWNAGKQSVKKENILEPITITLTNCQILEATIHRRSRDVCGTALDLANIQEGKIKINWGILEKNDGCAIQLIYAGPRNQPIQISGTIEGQKNISLYRPELEQHKPSERLPIWLQLFMYIIIGSGFLVFSVTAANLILEISNKVNGNPSKISKPLSQFILIIFGYGIIINFVTWWHSQQSPPFGF